MIAQDFLPFSISYSLHDKTHSFQPIITVKCSGQSKAKQLCLNEACLQKRAFTCFNLACMCQAEHNHCHKGDVEYVVKQIRQKMKGLTTEIKQKINKKFEDIIDQLSECRNNLLAKLVENEDLINLSVLTDLQSEFIGIVEGEDQNQSHKEKQFTGKQGRKIWDLTKENKKPSISLLENIKAELDSFESQQVGLKCLHEERIYEIYDKFEAIEKQNLKRKGVKISQQKFIPSIILKNSSIIRKQKEAETFLSFFTRQVNDLKLLFRASENQFRMEEYFKKCENSLNTVFICKTNHDKVIGAYSPLPHNYTGKGYEKQQNGEYEHDPSCESFIFSLTNGDKFEVKKEFRAIFRPKDNCYVCFGANEFRISEEKDKKAVGWTDVSKYYQNKKYRKTDPKFYEMLNGNEGKEFEIKEWEVWQVEMKV